MSLIARRISGAFLGNGFARAMRVVEQISLVPLLLSAWGIEQYGEWMVLISVTMFVGVASFGIGQAAYSDIVIHAARDDQAEARRVLVGSVSLITAIGIIVSAVLVVITTWFDPAQYLAFTALPPASANASLCVLGCSVVLGFYVDPFAAVIGAVRGAGLPNFLFGASKVIEIVCIMVALRFMAGPVAIALIILCAVALNVVANVIFAMRYASWLRFRWADLDRVTILAIIRTALGFFCLSVSLNIVYVQIPRLLVFHAFGAMTLSIFTVCVTYTRAARNLICMIPQSIQVEFGRMFAAGAIEKLRSAIEATTAATVIAGACGLLGVLAMSPVLIPLWTHGTVAVQWPLLMVLGLVSVVGTYFDPLLVAATAINKLRLVSVSYAIALLIGLTVAYLIASRAGVAAVAACSLLPAELAGAFAGKRTVEKAVGHIKFDRGAHSVLNSVSGVWSAL